MQEYKICFIISHRYYRNYQSYLKYYIDNINTFYENSLILVVDNNSKYLNDISSLFADYKNVMFLINETICKFEIGAYKVGIRFIYENNLINNYDYYIFTQDNFILKNKFDFNTLTANNTTACALNTYTRGKHEYYYDTTQRVLAKLNLQNSIDKLTLCWCNSFVLHKSMIFMFFEIVKDIIITVRRDSCCSERYLSGILYYLNNNVMTSIDGDIEIHNLKYDCWTVDLLKDNIKERFFMKKVQQKTENTPDN